LSLLAAAAQPGAPVPVFASATGMSARCSDMGWAQRRVVRGEPAAIDFAGGGWLIGCEDLRGPFTTLRLRVRGAPASALEVQLDTGLGAVLPKVPLSQGAVEEAGDGWLRVAIGFGLLDPSGAAIRGVLFRAADKNVGLVLIDDVELVPGPPAPAPLAAAAGLAAPSVAARGRSRSRLWVSAYYAGYFWNLTASDGVAAVAEVDFSNLTHLIFARYAPGAGTLGGAPGALLKGAGTGHEKVESLLIARAHSSGVKALMMIGGAGDGKGFVASSSPMVRSTFIGNILDAVVSKDYDGVDVDWEEAQDSAPEQEQMIAFLSELRTAASVRARYRPPNAPFLITFPGFVVNVNGDLPVPKWKARVAALVDQYNLMSYHMAYVAPGWQSWLWAPIKDAGPRHPMSIESSIDAYVQAGIPREKLGLGLGLYGGGYTPPVTGPRQLPSAEWGGNDAASSWADLYTQGMFSSGVYHFDAAAQAGYFTYSPARTYRGQSVSMLITEDLQSIAAKGAWARAGNCGGAIVWTLNYGYVPSLRKNPPMEAIRSAFLE
jgi:chitinase